MSNNIPTDKPSYNAVPPPKHLVSRDRRSPFVHNVAANSVGAKQIFVPSTRQIYKGDTIDSILEVSPNVFKHQPGSSSTVTSSEVEFRNGNKFIRPVNPIFPKGAAPSRNPLFTPSSTPSKFIGTNFTTYGRENSNSLERAQAVFAESNIEAVTKKQQTKPRKLDGLSRLGATSSVGGKRSIVSTPNQPTLKSKPFTQESHLEQQEKATLLSKRQTVAIGVGAVASSANTAICNYYKTFAKISPVGGGSGDFSPGATRADQIEASDRQKQLDAAKQNQKTDRIGGIIQTGIGIAELGFMLL